MAIIKVSSLHSILHESNSFKAENKKLLQEISKLLEEKIVVSDLNDYDCDLKLIFIESGGSERLFLEKIKDTRPPYYFLTSGSNNSLAASIEILSYLNNHSIKGEIIHGSFEYMAKRIKELVKNNQVMNYLRNTNLGVIGKPSDWLISSIPGYNQIKDLFDIHLINISLEELYDGIMKFDNFKIEDKYPLDYDPKELNKSNEVYQSLNHLVKKYNLRGLTLRCFDLLDKLNTTGCLGMAYLNSQGIIATCEGDIMAMISMYLIKAITDKSSFQANPSKIDIENNEIVFAHCSVPFDMLDSYHLDSHFESKKGVAIKGNLKEDVVTIFRYSSDLKNYFVSKGRIIKNLDEKTLCRTQILVKLDSDVSQLLTKPCGNHHIIVYGDYVDRINSFMKYLIN